jgi:MFS family permease
MRSVILLGLLVSPTALFAEVCDKERPLWNGGPVFAWQEALYYLTSPIGWPLLAVCALALLFQRSWLWVICGIVAALIGWAAIKLPHLDDISVNFYELMQQEGCLGPPHLSIAICAAISVSSFYTAFKRRKTQKETTCSKD